MDQNYSGTTGFKELTMDALIEKIVDEELALAKTKILTRINKCTGSGNESPAQRSMNLKFRNKISKPVCSGAHIKGEGDKFLEVVLIDESTGNLVDVGPEASASVKLFVLKGDACVGDEWTTEEFSENIVQEMEGKSPILAGNVCLTMKRGIAVLENVKFRHHTIKIKPPFFRLGARVVGMLESTRIKEAVTESFTVKDYRYKYSWKHKNPNLSDEVWRLLNIGKGGEIEKRLREAKICNVEQFLIWLLIDPQGLKSIVNLGEKKWEATIGNARNCRTEERLYCYIDFQEDRGVVFNVLGKVLALYAEGLYSPAHDILSGNQKADSDKLLQSAYEHWEDAKSFNNENSAREYLSCLMQNVGHPQSPKPDYSSCYEEASLSKDIGEPSNGQSNCSFQSVMNQETFIEDFDMEIMDDPTLEHGTDHSPLDIDAMFPDFEPFLRQNDNSSNKQLKYIINESNELTAGSQVVRIYDGLKRWKKVFCVSTWFSIWKRKALESTHQSQKRQKIF